MAKTRIDYFRGDTEPIAMTFTNSKTGDPIDLTGCTLTFTVNSEKDPIDNSNQLFQIAGNILGDPTEGKVEFPPNDGDTDLTPATYYFDVQRTDSAGRRKTFGKGEFRITQDITKN